MKTDAENKFKYPKSRLSVNQVIDLCCEHDMEGELQELMTDFHTKMLEEVSVLCIKYMDHRDNCDVYEQPSLNCNCGLDKLIQHLKG